MLFIIIVSYIGSGMLNMQRLVVLKSDVQLKRWVFQQLKKTLPHLVGNEIYKLYEMNSQFYM